VKRRFGRLDFVRPFERGGEERDAEAEELRRQNAELRTQVEELRKRPAAKPAHEEVKAAAATTKTGNKGLDRIAALMKK
jgi:type II secretory pathway component PulM